MIEGNAESENGYREATMSDQGAQLEIWGKLNPKRSRGSARWMQPDNGKPNKKKKKEEYRRCRAGAGAMLQAISDSSMSNGSQRRAEDGAS